MHGGLNLQTFTVSRKGRKRKAGHRHPGGQLVDRVFDPKVIASVMPHRQSVPVALRHDARAETELGRMLLIGLITDQEYQAGVWYSMVVSKYRAMIEAPSPNPPSLDIGGAVARGRAFIDDDEAQRRSSQYRAAFEAVEETAGHRGAVAVKRTAIHDEPCPSDHLGHLRRGLIALAVHRGLLKPNQALDMVTKLSHYRNRG